MKTIANNKKAFHDYEIGDKYEAGIELKGSEVKAIRASRVNLKDSFVRIINGEAWAFGIHISYLEQANPHFKPDESRARRLLLHKKQILKLEQSVMQQGMALVPISLYFNDRNKVKLQIGVAKGKNLYDKRHAQKDKELNREAQAAMKKNYKDDE